MADKVLELVTKRMKEYINLGENVQKLDKMLNVLDHQASDVVTIVENEELYRGKKRKREVEEWLKEVDKKKKDFASLKEQVQQAGRISYSRMQLAQRANAMVDEISSLTQQRGLFGELLLDADESKGLPLVEIEWRGPSFQRNLQKIWAMLIEEEITSVGIYGMGGVGKTTLAKFIYNDLLPETIFSDRVCWITASQEANIHKVQNDIAKAIQLDLSDEDDEMKRAAKLFHALKRRGKFVILVDDVWTHFDVEKMGIPLQGNKLIVTSRSVDVCHKMGCQMQIKVTPLCSEEAWKLFQVKLGRRDEELPLDVKEIAKSMAKRCVGLPLAIATVAGSMKGGDDIYEWRDAWDDLKQCPVGEDDAVFPILEYSYNRLRDQRLKDCFLCCSLYPEDYEIRRDELIILFISEGLIEKKSRQAEFDCGHTILNKLENVCLLEGVNDIDGKYVKMHDLIRDMALKITKSGKPQYMVKAGIGLKDIPEEREWKEDLDKVSLMNNDIQLLRSGKSPKCPKLSTLILQKSGLNSISDSFFAHLGELQILDLGDNDNLTKLPDCISDMKNLKALFLQFCEGLRVVPPLGNLEALIELDLQGTNIEEVPKGLERLVKLRSLNMDFTVLRNIPRGILSKLCSLRNLRLPHSVRVRAEELEALKDLEEFQISFVDVDNLNQFVRSFQSHVRLNFYSIRVEPPPDKHVEPKSIIPYRMTGRKVNLLGLGLGRGKSEVLLPEDVEHLSIRRCYTLSGCVGESLSELNLIQSRGLTTCFIENFKGIKWILKLTASSNSSFSSSADEVVGNQHGENVVEKEGQIVFSPCAPLQKLESLYLIDLPNLLGLLEWESIVADATLLPATFSCLKLLRISSCPLVTKLFTPKLLLRCLQNLQVLDVADCGVEEIITAEDEETTGFGQCSESPRTNTTVVQINLPKLKRLNLRYLPNLRSIYKGTLICDSLETIFILGCSNLTRMPLFLPTINGQLSPTPALREIQFPEREQEWWESLEWDNPQSRHVIQPFISYKDYSFY